MVKCFVYLLFLAFQTIYQDPVTGIDIENQTLKTTSGKLLKYGSLFIATGCTASRCFYSIFSLGSDKCCYTIVICRLKLHYLYSLVLRFPDRIGGGLPGVHYIRDVADADSLISSLVNSVYSAHPLAHC